MSNKTKLEGNTLFVGGKEFDITGNIDLRELDLSDGLPEGLNVGGYLDLEGTNITSLPDNLSVGGYLDLEGTNITSLPDNLSVGWLDLSGTNITSLPDNLNVGGFLDLEGTNITSLPDNLNVGGYLDLEGTNITSLPSDLIVKGEIYGSNPDGISYTDMYKELESKRLNNQQDESSNLMSL